MHQVMVYLISFKKILLEIKGQICSDTVIVGDFNPPLSSIDR
jgi:hypothetical protein